MLDLIGGFILFGVALGIIAITAALVTMVLFEFVKWVRSWKS